MAAVVKKRTLLFKCKFLLSDFHSSKSGTGSVTPVQEESGSVTPKEPTKEKPNKTTKKLKKVKRALKTLGVNFLTFDEENEKNSNKDGVDQCEKEYCRLGKFISVYVKILEFLQSLGLK